VRARSERIVEEAPGHRQPELRIERETESLGMTPTMVAFRLLALT
jgi:hypothetical protein